MFSSEKIMLFLGPTSADSTSSSEGEIKSEPSTDKACEEVKSDETRPIKQV